MQKILFLHYKNIIEKCIDTDYTNLISIDPPKDKSFGDFSTNIAMIIAKKLRCSSMEIAEKIFNNIKNNDNFSDLNIKKPGFINWNVPKKILLDYFSSTLEPDFGKANFGNGINVNIEYVSANPTGPLHAGHARGAVSGDVVANLMSFVGYNVTKEYYINDAGKQTELLAKSLYLRYLELCGKQCDTNNISYPGLYLIETAKKILKLKGDTFINAPKSTWLPFFKEFAINDMMQHIKKDLHALGIKHDVFISESEIVKNGIVEKTIDFLKQRDLVYIGTLDIPKGKEPDDWESREQLLFRSTKFGDDIDRPLQKSDGTWTYFASDIAYHSDKINRGFAELIDFWGADHGGYIKRMQAAVSAISNGTKSLDIKISQIVKFIENDKEVKMSKRAGTFISIKDVIESVGKDVIRFIMLTRRDDAPLDFNFKKVVDQSRDNPVFYIQYAYARTHSVFKQFKASFPQEHFPSINDTDLSLLETDELQLIKILCDWPRQVIMAAKNKEPHRLTFYLSEIASHFHSLWNQGKDNTTLRFIVADNLALTRTRMILLKAIQNVIEIAFKIIGITPMEELR